MNHDLGKLYFADKTEIDLERKAIAFLLWAYVGDFTDIASCKLQPDFFSNTSHSAIFRTIQEVSDEGLPVTPSVVQERFGGGDAAAFEGWEAWSEILGTNPPSVPYRWIGPLLLWLSANIRKTHFRAEMVRATQDYAEALVKKDSEAQRTARAQIEEIEIAAEETEALEIAPAILKTMDFMESRINDRKKLLTTGIEKLDEYTTGFCEGELWVIGARPSQGKTSLALNMFDAASVVARCHFISLEMTLEQLVSRWNVMHSGVPMNVMSSGRGYKTQDVKRIQQAFVRIREHAAAITDNQSLSELANLRAEIISAAKKGAKVIFIDYLQLIVVRGERDRRLQIDAITRSAKRLAMQFRVSIVLLAQLRRDVDNKTPTMASLKESSGIEQDADKIILIDRPNKTNESESKSEPAYIILEKQRNGITGDVAVDFDPVRMRFTQSHHRREYG